MQSEVVLAIIALMGSLGGALLGTQTTLHRLDKIEKFLEKMEEVATKVTEHEIKIKHLEKTVFSKKEVSENA